MYLLYRCLFIKFLLDRFLLKVTCKTKQIPKFTTYMFLIIFIQRKMLLPFPWCRHWLQKLVFLVLWLWRLWWWWRCKAYFVENWKYTHRERKCKVAARIKQYTTTLYTHTMYYGVVWAKKTPPTYVTAMLAV